MEKTQAMKTTKNILVIKELYGEEEVNVYELPNDEKEAAEVAKTLFNHDLEEERENSSDVDENNTFWDDETQNGQIQWISLSEPSGLRRTTYDITSIKKR